MTKTVETTKPSSPDAHSPLLESDTTEAATAAAVGTPSLQTSTLVPTLSLTALLMGIGMYLFQCLKHFVLPEIQIWQSHFITIAFSSVVAAGVAYLVVRRIEAFKDCLAREMANHLEEHKQMTAELAAERERLHEIVDSVPAVIFENWTENETTGRRSFVSSHIEEMLGYSAKEWLASRDFWFSRVHPDDRKRVLADSAALFTDRGSSSKHVIRWLAKDDRVVWGETHLVAVRDETGRLCGVRGITFDVTERVRTDEELRWKTAFLEAKTHSSLDGILVVDQSRRRLLHNRKMLDVWRMPPHIVEERDDEVMLRYATASTARPEQFLQRVEHLYSNPNEIGHDEIELKDGRFLYRYTSPVFGEDGTYYGRIWAFRDITERKQADADLTERNKELVNLSRKVGMAEVATSVLHNVGNVLNSVNISLGIARDKVSCMKSAGLSRVVTLLDAHATDLPRFLAEHPQGAKLPHFLGQLARHFTSEQQAVLRELASLQANIEHINEVVAMQQNYATAGGLIEVLPLAELVHDALRMNAAACERDEIQIVCEFDPALPPVSLDRNKMLLILVNLIRNARHACEDGGQAEKCITLRTEFVRPGSAKVSVSDNGIGIPREILTRIFEYGFTTRKNGHGFGLHSSALAAQEMGGSLGVQSDGPGCGATFTIELPL